MFDVDPAQIQSLSSLQLVGLLRRLLHAEALASELELGNISVPLQITVADGGEDGSIRWEGGRESTHYLPSRINVFQAKATKMGKAAWKKECWVKSTQAKNATRVLTPALTSLTAEGGSYLGFTSEAITGDKQKECIKAIKDGIREAGGDPDVLKAIKIYGANEIAAWSERHPAVAIWLAEQAHLQSLAGYRTIESWGMLDDFVRNSYAPDPDKRYAIGSEVARDRDNADNRTTSDVAWRRILEHVATAGSLVRIVGASGLGKSRFVHQSLKASSSQLDAIFRNSAVFADYRVVSATVLPTATRLAERGLPTLLIVDECPRDAAMKLAEIASSAGSALRVVTLDTDDRPLEGDTVLHVALSPSGGDLVEAIVRAKNSSIDAVSIERLRQMCGGFPRFAVLAAGNPSLSPSDFESADDVVDRILRGTSITGEAELRALQSLSLFERVMIEGSSGGSPMDQVATMLGRMSGDEMYEHLAKARQHDLVGLYAGAFSAQPVPIAVNMASRRLKVIRPSLLQHFLSTASDELVLSLLRRWKYLDNTQVVIEAATRFLKTDDQFATLDNFVSSRAMALLDTLVHIVPDLVADALWRRLLKNDERLPQIDQSACRHLVGALSKLVFRSRSFGTAARLLMRLAASKANGPGNNSGEVFQQLFQLQLSGTEASPGQRFSILDEGLESDDEATRSICVDALARVFNRNLIRFGDTGQIGSGPRLKDWSPKTYGEVNDFYSEGIKRLAKIRRRYPELAERSEMILAGAARSLLSTGVHEEYAACLLEIDREKRGWPEVLESVGDWLYFDRKSAPVERALFVRELYNQLFPSDPIDRAILFTKFWRTDIRDPDANYAVDRDFDYSERQARAVAAEIASSPDQVVEAVVRITPLDLKSVHPFAEELGSKVEDRKGLFEAVLKIVEETGTGFPMLRGVLRGIDLNEHELADTCFDEATDRVPEKYRVDLYSALAMDERRLRALIADVRSGRVDPAQCVFLSYGRGFDRLDIADVAELLFELAEHGGDGAWAALEISMMYRHGSQPSPQHAAMIGKLLTNSNVIGPATKGRREAHIVDDLVQKIQGLIASDGELASGLAELVGRMVESDDYDIFSALDDAVRNVVALLREHAPLTVWSQVTQLYGSATPIERNRLKRLIGPSSERFDQSSDFMAGPLFGVPVEPIYEWADGDAGRPPLLVDFYPILEDEAATRWHPDLEIIASRYGDNSAFREALAKRMRPSSWSGSIVPLLEIYLAPLKSWFGHPVRSLAAWANEQYHHVERQIEIERDLEKQ
ncbi:hypothetical protein U8Q06_12540 [Rhizobium beringeri]|uniref:hypothetical protein n=1 Tax=Rhizobium beringeri TaxID=3019934 RepID=UPI002E118B0B|nr:hypothetical protein U8Q06_12540 [Rhizobium beringeri]